MERRTLVTFLLDRSGSMESIKGDTIGAFNAYLSGLQGDGDLIDFTLVQFDTQGIDKVCVGEPVGKAPALSKENFQPRSGTPLIDAAYKTIKAVAKSLGDRQAVVCIQTDGHENSSTEHGWDDLNALIKEKTEEGWQFNFLGAGIDAYDQGARMGISAAATMSYDPSNLATTKAAFAESAIMTASYASGRSANTHLSMQARRAAGDVHAHRVFGGANQPDPAAMAKTIARPVPARPKHKAVDDFAL